MLNKTRSDSRLSQLTPEQQAEIYRRLKTQTYAAVQHWLAQPPPEGLGFKTHINSLYRFFHRYDVTASFTLSMTAALSPALPTLQHRIRLGAIEECGRLVATNANARAAFNLVSKQLYQFQRAEMTKAYQDVALEQQRLAAARQQTKLELAALRAKNSA